MRQRALLKWERFALRAGSFVTRRAHFSSLTRCSAGLAGQVRKALLIFDDRLASGCCLRKARTSRARGGEQ